MWFVPQDPQGLIDLFGGVKPFIQKLNEHIRFYSKTRTTIRPHCRPRQLQAKRTDELNAPLLSRRTTGNFRVQSYAKLKITKCQIFIKYSFSFLNDFMGNSRRRFAARLETGVFRRSQTEPAENATPRSPDCRKTRRTFPLGKRANYRSLTRTSRTPPQGSSGARPSRPPQGINLLLSHTPRFLVTRSVPSAGPVGSVAV